MYIGNGLKANGNSLSSGHIHMDAIVWIRMIFPLTTEE
jgi:hypothetical protein